MIAISSASQAASASTASPPIRLAIGWMRLPVSRRVWVRSRSRTAYGLGLSPAARLTQPRKPQ